MLKYIPFLNGFFNRDGLTPLSIGIGSPLDNHHMAIAKLAPCPFHFTIIKRGLQAWILQIPINAGELMGK